MTGQYQLPQFSNANPAVVVVKDSSCSSNGVLDLLKTYWWVLLIIILGFLYYKYQLNKKDENHPSK